MSAACLAVEALRSRQTILPSLMRKDWRFGEAHGGGGRRPKAFATCAVGIGDERETGVCICPENFFLRLGFVFTDADELAGPCGAEVGVVVAQAAGFGGAAGRVGFRVENRTSVMRRFL